MFNKKILTLFILAVAATVLAGCISIPIGDGNSLKLSKEGVTVKSKDGDETTFGLDEDEDGNVTIKGEGSDGQELNIGVDQESGSINMSGVDEEGEEREFSMEPIDDIPEQLPSDIPIP